MRAVAMQRQSIAKPREPFAPAAGRGDAAAPNKKRQVLCKKHLTGNKQFAIITVEVGTSSFYRPIFIQKT